MVLSGDDTCVRSVRDPARGFASMVANTFGALSSFASSRARLEIYTNGRVLACNKSAPAFLMSWFLMPHASRFVRVVYALLLYHKVVVDDRNDTGLADGYAVTLDNGSHLRM